MPIMPWVIKKRIGGIFRKRLTNKINLERIDELNKFLRSVYARLVSNLQHFIFFVTLETNLQASFCTCQIFHPRLIEHSSLMGSFGSYEELQLFWTRMLISLLKNKTPFFVSEKLFLPICLFLTQKLLISLALSLSLSLSLPLSLSLSLK